jgi:hypothetical protein
MLMVFLGFLIFPATSNTDEVYKWRDKTGTLHIVDDMNQVPPKYRNQIESTGGKDKHESVKRPRRLEIKGAEEQRREYEMLIAQEEKTIERLRESIESLEQASLRTLGGSRAWQFRVSGEGSEIKDYQSGRTLATGRSLGEVGRDGVDSRPAVVISNDTIRIHEARDEIERRTRRIEEYRGMMDRLAGRDLKR